MPSLLAWNRKSGQDFMPDPFSPLMAALIRGRTAASTEWIAKRLQMGHPGSVSRQVGIVKREIKNYLKNSMNLKKCATAGTDPRDAYDSGHHTTFRN